MFYILHARVAVSLFQMHAQQKPADVTNVLYLKDCMWEFDMYEADFRSQLLFYIISAALVLLFPKSAT